MDKHWYAFSFIGSDLKGNPQVYASVYIGWDSEGVTKARIEVAKKGATVSPSATLLAVSYLGYMTREKFLDESEEFAHD